MQPLLETFPRDEHPTFFEVVTVMGLRYFAAQRCDLVIWETGLGGRLDATNIVTPLASVITNIQYDHQKYLGESLASIAREKAGIIKPGAPAITGAQEEESLEVIRQAAHECQAPLTIVPPGLAHRPPLDKMHLPLIGEHQKMNAAVALSVIRALDTTFPCSDEAINTGLSTVHWPGRLQLVRRPSGQSVLLDGAHNISGAESFVAALKEYFPEARPALVLGILRDKDWSHMCGILAPLASSILLVPVHSQRTAQPHGLAEACRRSNPDAEVNEFASLREALDAAAAAPFVAVAGSLYLIGEAMELLHLSPARVAEERSLNEWSVR
jgi:dihydrofolate synthase/folylpolyglutamate synthase